MNTLFLKTYMHESRETRILLVHVENFLASILMNKKLCNAGIVVQCLQFTRVLHTLHQPGVCALDPHAKACKIEQTRVCHIIFITILLRTIPLGKMSGAGFDAARYDGMFGAILIAPAFNHGPESESL